MDGVGVGRRRRAPRRTPGTGRAGAARGGPDPAGGRPVGLSGDLLDWLACIAAPTSSSSGPPLVMGALAVITAIVLDKRLADPEGFLGPSWLRLPMLLFGAFLLDMLPRTALARRGWIRGRWRGIVRERVRTHWTRERLTLVVMGAGLLLHHLRQLPEPQVVPAVRDGRREVRPGAAPRRHGAVPRPRARRPCCTPCSAPTCSAHVAVGDLPVVPAAGAAGAHRLADLVAQHLLRLLVRHLAVHRLDARDGVVLRAADARPGPRVPLALRRPGRDADRRS